MENKATETLGEGTFGQVRASPTDSKIAIKTFKRPTTPEEEQVGVPTEWLREVCTLAKLQTDRPSLHLPRLVKLPSPEKPFELHMERLDLGLDQYMAKLVKEKKTLPLETIRNLTRQLVVALAHCHQAGIVHRDVKPQNIMLQFTKETPRLVLIDFSAARSTTPLQGVWTPNVVTLFYRAPEVLLHTTHGSTYGGKYGPALDLWALGCIVAELALLHCLFFVEPKEWSEVNQLACIFQTLGTPSNEVLAELVPTRPTPCASTQQPRPKFPHWRSKTMKTILAKTCLEDCPDGLDFLDQVLQFLPSRRLGAKQLLQHPFLFASA